MKKTIVPEPIQPDIDELIKYAELKEPTELDRKRVKVHVERVKAHFIDAGSLIRVSSFAALSNQFKGAQVTRGAIYQQIDRGTLAEIQIDRVKFILLTQLEQQ